MAFFQRQSTSKEQNYKYRLKKAIQTAISLKIFLKLSFNTPLYIKLCIFD